MKIKFDIEDGENYVSVESLKEYVNKRDEVLDGKTNHNNNIYVLALLDLIQEIDAKTKGEPFRGE